MAKTYIPQTKLSEQEIIAGIRSGELKVWNVDGNGVQWFIRGDDEPSYPPIYGERPDVIEAAERFDTTIEFADGRVDVIPGGVKMRLSSGEAIMCRDRAVDDVIQAADDKDFPQPIARHEETFTARLLGWLTGVRNV
jgi:hypothetical protein